MTKLEALAKDCIENHTHKLVDKPTKQDIYLREESIFIQGYRQSEKRIAELEYTNKRISDECHKLVDSLEQKQNHIAALEKHIAELERKLEQTEKDLADYQFNYPTIKKLEKEIAELKEEIEERLKEND